MNIFLTIVDPLNPGSYTDPPMLFYPAKKDWSVDELGLFVTGGIDYLAISFYVFFISRILSFILVKLLI
jgi:hypothetical protein